ncbi:MAG: PEP-CTERM sorting domain-containing protein [Phycisphaeraceae bacterium]|nr:PEP-CTERM sorting domain-containing protein [Phycisphaeraceae bacterium]
MNTYVRMTVLAALSATLLSAGAAMADMPPFYTTAVVDGPTGRTENYSETQYNEAITSGVSNVGYFEFIAKAGAQPGVLQNYVSGLTSLPGMYAGTVPWFSAESVSFFAEQMTINAPNPDFWSSHHSYLIEMNFGLHGTINKTTQSQVSMSYTAILDNREVYMRSVLSAYYDMTTSLTDLVYNQSADVQWTYDLNDAQWDADGSLLFELDLQLSVGAYGRGNNPFSATADFFNTAQVNSISLLTQDEGGAPTLVVTFDHQGNVIAGNSGFVMNGVPEPATLTVLAAAGMLTILRRRKA